MSSWCIHLAAIACSLLAVLLYANTLKAGLVFDDQAAILTNRDLLPSSPWSNLLFHDFWGEDIRLTSSHKSFRPITSASFKLNYHLHGNQPVHYHSVNIVLNALVSYLFVMLAHCVLDMDLGLAVLAGVLYTVHPLHTEAVAGVVGRAELLSAIFFIMTIFTYQQAAKSRQIGWRWLLLSMLLSLCSMFSKEQGISVVAACITYETFIVLKLNLGGGFRVIHTALFRSKEVSTRNWHFLMRSCSMCMFLLLVIVLRIILMNGGPRFSKSDNPGQRLATPLRQTYYLHLVFANVWLFLCPSKLRHDWRFGPVPLFSSLSDSRSISTIVTFISLGTLGLSSIMKRSKYDRITDFSFWLAVLTFLPSSNLFFLVGFVLAERVLYLPTMGASILVAIGMWTILEHNKISRFCKALAKCSLFCLLLAYSVKTVHRNQVWESGFNLYVDALKLYPTDGLMFSNLGYDLGHRNQTHLAEECHIMAVNMAPRYSQPFRNYGSFLQSQKRYDEAEKMYREAIQILGQGRRSKRSRQAATYQALAEIVSKNGSRLDDAVSILKAIIKLEPNEPDSYIMLGKLMLRLNKTALGKSIFENTLKMFPDGLGLAYEAAEACQMAGYLSCAEHLYASILSRDRNQGIAMLKYGILISEKDNATAEELIRSRTFLHKVIRANSSFVEAFYALASINVRLNMQMEAQDNVHRALAMQPSHPGSIKNLARLLYTQKNYSTTAEVLNMLSLEELSLRENSMYLNILGSSYMELGLFARAVELYKAVVEQGSQNTEAYLVLAKLYKQSRNEKEAKKTLELAQQLNETKSSTRVT